MTTKWVCMAALLAISVLGATHARDRFDRPSLTVAAQAPTLGLAFANPELWDGKHIQRVMQCRELGGDNPTSPAMDVTGFPDATQSLVVYFANPRSFHNHGTFRVRTGHTPQTWRIASIRSGAGEKLPKGIELYDGGSTWGRAYNAPCPTQGAWLYTVTVYALDSEDKVIAIGEKELGYAP